MNNIKNIIKNRNFKYGSYATAVTAGFITLVILINVILGLLTGRVIMHIDLTNTQRYQFDTMTTDFLKTIDTEINIYVLESEVMYDMDITEVLRRYELLCDKIKVHFVDIYKNSKFLEKYSARSTPTTGGIIVESDKRFRTMTYDDMFLIQNEERIGLRVEHRITTALMYVTTDNISYMYFTEGHGEDESLYDFADLLYDNNVMLDTINLLTDEIHPQATFMTIIAPQKDFSMDEISILDKFLENDNMYDRNLIVIFDPSTPKLPNLESFLEEWGISIEPYVIYDSKANLAGNPAILTARYADEGQFSGSIDSKTLLVVPQSRAMRPLFENKDVRSVTKILESSSDSYAKSGTQAQELIYKEEGDQTGPFTMMMLANKTRYAGASGTIPLSSNILVSGSKAMFSDAIITVPSYANADLLINIINYMRNENDSIRIRVKDLRIKPLTIDGNIVQPLSYAFIGGIPALVLALGIMTWLKRRHL